MCEWYATGFVLAAVAAHALHGARIAFSMTTYESGRPVPANTLLPRAVLWLSMGWGLDHQWQPDMLMRSVRGQSGRNKPSHMQKFQLLKGSVGAHRDRLRFECTEVQHSRWIFLLHNDVFC